ncbi:MAG: retroviral-like aspartic protease family protein [Caldilineaceae bacterium]
MYFKFGKSSGGEPLPTLPLRLLDEDGKVLSEEKIAIVDTGADGTIIPLSILKAAGLRPNRQRRNLFTVQHSTPEETLFGYSIAVQIGELQLFDVDVFGSRTVNDAIIGRNILNRMIFTYHGSQHLLEILDAE